VADPAPVIHDRDRILVLVYLFVVPAMILVIVIIGALQTRDAKNAVEQTAGEARAVALQTCQHTNQRDRILTQVVHLFVSLTKSSTDLTADEQKTLNRIESLSRRLRPQDCTP
jgi:hypothetical protein